MTKETKLRLQKMSRAEREKLFKKLNESVAHPKPLVGDNPPEITLDDMEERAWLHSATVKA